MSTWILMFKFLLSIISIPSFCKNVSNDSLLFHNPDLLPRQVISPTGFWINRVYQLQLPAHKANPWLIYVKKRSAKCGRKFMKSSPIGIAWETKTAASRTAAWIVWKATAFTSHNAIASHATAPREMYIGGRYVRVTLPCQCSITELGHWHTNERGREDFSISKIWQTVVTLRPAHELYGTKLK